MIASKLVGQNGKVLVIEPQEKLWSVIARNIMLNYCDNTKIIPYTIGEQNSKVEITPYPSINTGVSLIGANVRINFYNTQMVKSRCLNDILGSNHIERVKLIKIDIEGF